MRMELTDEVATVREVIEALACYPLDSQLFLGLADKAKGELINKARLDGIAQNAGKDQVILMHHLEQIEGDS